MNQGKIIMKVKKWQLLVISFGVCLALSGCFWKKKDSDGERDIHLYVSSAETLNRDVTHQNSPVYLTIYQLNQSSAFKDADFFALKGTPFKVLGSDFLSRQSWLILPNQEEEELTVTVNNKVKYLGLVAEFSVLNAGSWKVTQKIDKDVDEIYIQLKDYKMQIGDE